MPHLFCLRSLCFIAILISLLSGSVAYARITKVVIDRVESPTFEGQEFGSSGRYEKIVGRMFGEVDHGAAENQGIVNLAKAPRNAAGRIVYSTDFYLLKPVEPSKGNRRLFYGVINRGNKIDLVLMNNAPYGESTNDPTAAADAGNGFLMRQGYTIAWSGWQTRGNIGQFIPFTKTRAEREAAGDPRPSLAERYPTKQDYVTRVKQAVRELQAQRLLLEEDAAAYLADAERKLSNLW